ncbi:serine/threonine-protein kinase 33-like [Limulus polyphemus]|uniref:Serine/threonine-protein kinase 33-like n=1 Tax=Limulus polyphemus TaxID=6850 RepID=A0ABM1SBT0_LIMPO|nr:serine/threonine-protein kinase 33-like [Limulus polyphemus]
MGSINFLKVVEELHRPNAFCYTSLSELETLLVLAGTENIRVAFDSVGMLHCPDLFADGFSSVKPKLDVTDFSLAVVKGGAGQENMLQDSCGTPVYMGNPHHLVRQTPELWDKKSYSQQCDVWSMGIIMYWLLCGSPPFIAPHTDALSTLIKQAKLNFGSPSWKDVSENAKFLIQGMLRVDPAHRLTASEVLHNPWTKGTSNTSSNSNFPQPSNVLEMMQMWHQELRHQEAPLQSVESENDSEWDISLDSSSQLQETTGKRQPEKSSLSSKSSSVTRGTKVRFTGKKTSLLEDVPARKTVYKVNYSVSVEGDLSTANFVMIVVSSIMDIKF